MLIQAHNISIVRNRRSILHKVSLEVQAGDFTTIIGPNGAGKSTLLKVLMGLIPCDRGTVQRKAALRLGYVPQGLNMNAALPITVSYFLQLHKHCSLTLMDWALEATGCTELRERQLHELSGGELQRVLLARSLLGDPELLVLDEPVQNLDVKSQLVFYRLLEQIYEERRLSIIMVSHDLHWVMASTQQVICLYQHICCSGKPQKVAQDPAFLNLFGNEQARFMAFYQHSHDHTHP